MEFLFFGLLEGVHIFFVALQLTLEVKVLSALIAHHRLLLQRERIKIAKKWLKVTFLCILLRCWLRFVYFFPHSGHSNWNKIVFEVEDWFEGICHCHLVTFVNQPYVLPQITVLLSANRTWSAALEAKNIEHRQPGWISKPYRGHLQCASQDLSSDNSCSRSHRTCISSAKNEVDELGENMRNKAWLLNVALCLG